MPNLCSEEEFENGLDCAQVYFRVHFSFNADGTWNDGDFDLADRRATCRRFDIVITIILVLRLQPSRVGIYSQWRLGARPLTNASLLSSCTE
jgi:hypothetical protein